MTPSNELQAARVPKLLKTHVKYIIAFNGNECYRFYFCGPLPGIHKHHITLEGIKIHISPLYEIGISPINFQCDCSEQYHLREIPNERIWQDLPRPPKLHLENFTSSEEKLLDTPTKLKKTLLPPT